MRHVYWSLALLVLLLIGAFIAWLIADPFA